ncbi:hypothetical protein [Sphingomonas sp. G-3-2-10]|uniref:hypothetical protein n=1 Tax=Sphingomonas sp. G-3-2-10 TaxID=2728838 RepID=UPI00146F1B00|nr:hypothetical protein [Sphingomonas sp. G-3-2-10]NML05917.1 hypothetical protein [Sphingomonas sp. G-3-2-10]
MFTVSIVALAQAAIFAPPLDVPIRVIATRTESDGIYRAERLVRFHRDGTGYRAEVRLIAATAETSDFRKSMFDAGYARLAGRTIEFRLDAAGKVTAIADLAGHWNAFCNGLAALASKHTDNASAERKAAAGQIADRFRAMPEEQQRAILASLVTVMIGGDGNEAAGTTRAIRLPATSPFGGSASLDGTRSFERNGGLVRSVTRAEGQIASPDGAPAYISVETLRDTDPHTGLITATRETTHTRRGSDIRERSSTVTMSLEPGAVWPD